MCCFHLSWGLICYLIGLCSCVISSLCVIMGMSTSDIKGLVSDCWLILREGGKTSPSLQQPCPWNWYSHVHVRALKLWHRSKGKCKNTKRNVPVWEISSWSVMLDSRAPWIRLYIQQASWKTRMWLVITAARLQGWATRQGPCFSLGTFPWCAQSREDSRTGQPCQGSCSGSVSQSHAAAWVLLQTAWEHPPKAGWALACLVFLGDQDSLGPSEEHDSGIRPRFEPWFCYLNLFPQL